MPPTATFAFRLGKSEPAGESMILSHPAHYWTTPRYSTQERPSPMDIGVFLANVFSVRLFPKPVVSRTHPRIRASE